MGRRPDEGVEQNSAQLGGSVSPGVLLGPGLYGFAPVCRTPICLYAVSAWVAVMPRVCFVMSMIEVSLLSFPPYLCGSHKTRKVRDLWWHGLPPGVRGEVWKKAIGNELNISPGIFACTMHVQYVYVNMEKLGMI